MNKGAIYSAIKNRKITLFIVILLMISGLYNYYITPKQEDPDLNAPVAIITSIYPGASPEDVERLVTSKIEDEIVEINGYDYAYSDSKNSLSIVVLRLDYDADIDKAWTELRQKMDDLKGELPQGCQDIQINTDVVETAGIIISMSGENYTYEELAAYAEGFKKELGKIEGISRFDITGKQEKEVKIEVDAARLNYYNVSLEDVANVIRSQNIEIPSGTIDDGNAKISVKTSGTYSSLKEIENTIILVSEKNGSVVRLKDIAKIYMDVEDSNYKIKQNGRNAVLLTGYFKENKNIVLIGREVEKKLDELKTDLPGDIIFDEVLYQPRDVSNSVNNFMVNLLEGILFVIIVVFVGMGFRNALIVSTAIPLSILMTFSAIGLFGIKIHQISIAALLVALGMLVDNAIVVSDAIQVRIDKGQDKMDACIDGVKEVAVPVLTSTLTTVGAFIPLVTLPSLAGEYISSLPKIVIIALLSSYLVALFVTPTMAYIFFEESSRKERTFRVRQLFYNMLNIGMKKRKATLIIVLIGFGMAMILATQLGLQFFPKADKNIIYIDIKTEQSGDISRTEHIADIVSDILRDQEEVISYTAAVGNGLPKFYDTVPIYTQSQDFAQIMVRLDLKKAGRFKTNSEFADNLQGKLDSQITGGTAIVKLLEKGEPIGAPVRVRITGKDIERLGEVAGQIRNKLSNIEGTINIDDDFSDKIYEFSVDVDVDRASSFGISKYDVQREVSIALRGKDTSVFRKDGNEYDIVVKSNIASIEELENLAIKSSITGNKVILKEIADINLKPQIPNIKKYDRDMAVTVYSDVKSGCSSVSIQEHLKNELKEMDLYDVSVVFDGEREKIRENFGNVGNSAIFAVLVVYGILLLQFKSFIQPLIILLTIPLSVIGSILGLFIFRQPLSFTGLLGMVSLLGIVVNNAIILMDYINNERKQGKGIEEACMEAVDKRFRPVTLSTTTTVMGLTPLAFSGSELFRPMSISLMSGLMISTLLTLVIIPVVYCMVEEKFEAYRENFKDKK